MEDQSPLDLFPLPGRQVPSADEVFFDHVAWLVHDMDAASEVFEKLGFKLTPYSVHGNRDPELRACPTRHGQSPGDVRLWLY